VLDDAQRRRIPEQPAREHRAPLQFLVGIGAIVGHHLDEGAFLLGLFPGQRALAGRQLDDDIADAFGLAGLEHDVLGQVVALVEQAERGDAVLHRGAVFAFHRRAGGGLLGERLGHLGRLLGAVGRIAGIAAGGEREDRQEGERPLHRRQASGDQAS